MDASGTRLATRYRMDMMTRVCPSGMSGTGDLSEGRVNILGRQYDSKGNLISWWTDKTLHKFEQGAMCFIIQYSMIKNPSAGLNINGENTLGENIADNGGLKLAYKVSSLRAL